MIAVYPVLRQRMNETNTTFRELAMVAGISVFALRLKFWGIKRWKLTEVLRICCFFHTKNAEHLFSKRRSSFVRK